MDKNNKDNGAMEKIISLCKRRGFIYPGSDIYGGLSNSWDYGPLGVELKNNIKKSWWNFFVHQRSDMYGLDAALIMNPKIWEASGHLSAGFADLLVECKSCHERYRADHIDLKKACQKCGKKDSFTDSKNFNLMFKTFIGPSEESANVAYLRPETAQAIFVNFKNISDSFSPKIPFGVAQIGKAFRNEITPGNFIFRTREFEQMEIEYFINPNGDKNWNEYFEEWLLAMKQWMEKVGINLSLAHDLETPKDELAHYSKRTVDIEFDYPFGRREELFGLAYRGDFDLKNHQEGSGQNLEYFDQKSNERFVPHVIEPSFGVDRALLALLSSAYKEEEIEGEKRTYLDLNIELAPFKAAVFPLLSNKEDLVNKAKDIYQKIKLAGITPIAFDEGGNIGKRYRKQDEIGTPYCFTVDFQTLEDNTVTVRDRNSMEQMRMDVDGLSEFLTKKISNQ